MGQNFQAKTPLKGKVYSLYDKFQINDRIFVFYIQQQINTPTRVIGRDSWGEGVFHLDG